MPKKFTVEEHEEAMRGILTPPAPVDRTGVVSSLLERVRGRRPAGVTPPRLPRLPKLPGERI